MPAVKLYYQVYHALSLSLPVFVLVDCADHWVGLVPDVILLGFICLVLPICLNAFAYIQLVCLVDCTGFLEFCHAKISMQETAQTVLQG